MKLLGIDYGKKRVGIAVADDATGIAFPKGVFLNDKELVENVKKMCDGENVKKIVIGESKDLKGEDNAIAHEIELFKKILERETALPVIYEPEFYTSVQASRLQGENDMIDASAAAIILQSFLDKFKE